MKIILIPNRSKTIDIEKKVFGENYKILTPNAKNSTEINDVTWSKVDAIVAWHDIDYNKNLISKLKQCKVIVRAGVGYDNIDLKSAGEKNILYGDRICLLGEEVVLLRWRDNVSEHE